MTPGWSKEYHICVRNNKNKKIMAIMMGAPRTYILKGNKIKMLEGNFFAINKALRNKRLAPIMVQEMCRRARLGGLFQMYYTSTSTFPTPFATSNFVNRLINI